MKITRRQLRKIIMEAMEEGSYGAEGEYAPILDEEDKAPDKEGQVPSLSTSPKARYAYLDKHGSDDWKSYSTKNETRGKT